MQWLIAFTKQLRSQLPATQYIIAHALVASWFEKHYAGGGYLDVNSADGPLIHRYNI
jgi:chitinase